MVKEVSIYAVVFYCLFFTTARSEASCGIPKAPGNVSVYVTDERKVGTLAHYFCDINATLVGESVSTCLPSGIWSSDAPKCLRSCHVPEIEDGQVGKYEWKKNFTRKKFISFKVGRRIKHHEKVIILCKDEYIPGNQETGRSQEVECFHGSWTEPLYCRPKISCKMPEAPRHGSLHLSDKLKVGTLAFFSCVDGATLVGVTTTNCLPSGKWSFDPPTCLLSCRGSPPVVENADAVILNNKDGGKVTYQCNEGFQKFNKETVVCDSGIWKGNVPACRRISCFDSPPKSENAYVESVDSTHEGKVRYRCNRGFENFMKGRVVCDSGTWKGVPIICKKIYVSCDPFPDSPNIDVTYKRSFRSKGFARFTCLNGTSLIGSPRARCLSNGTWDRPMPRCAENCTVPVLPHGDMRERKLGDLFFSRRSFRHERQVPYEKIPPGKDIANNVSVTLFCPRKYVFQGTSQRNAEITCVKGLWKPNPVCVRDYSCDLFPDSPKLTIRYTKGVQVESAALFTCLNSTSLIGSPVATCLSNGSWSHSLPSCEENCTVPVFQHDDMRKRETGDFFFNSRTSRLDRQESYKKVPSGTVVTNNSSLILFCLPEYSFKEIFLREITCINGEWNPDPVCTPIIKCEELKGNDLLVISYTNDRKVGSQALFHCFSPAQRSGASSADCLENGTWSNPTPTCTTPPCLIDDIFSVLPENIFLHLESRNRTFPFNATIKLISDGEMILEGEMIGRCNRKGEWDIENVQSPPCLIDDIFSVLPENIFLDLDSRNRTFPFNATIKLRCDGEMVLEGEAIGRCNRKGEWDIENVQCVIGCSKPATDPDSSLIFIPDKEVYKIFEIITFSCPPGMSLTSQPLRIMCLRFDWSENVLPDCQ